MMIGKVFILIANTYRNVIPAPYQLQDKLQRESSLYKNLWMPDQVRHDEKD